MLTQLSTTRNGIKKYPSGAKAKDFQSLDSKAPEGPFEMVSLTTIPSPLPYTIELSADQLADMVRSKDTSAETKHDAAIAYDALMGAQPESAMDRGTNINERFAEHLANSMTSEPCDKERPSNGFELGWQIADHNRG